MRNIQVCPVSSPAVVQEGYSVRLDSRLDHRVQHRVHCHLDNRHCVHHFHPGPGFAILRFGSEDQSVIDLCVTPRRYQESNVGKLTIVHYLPRLCPHGIVVQAVHRVHSHLRVGDANMQKKMLERADSESERGLGIGQKGELFLLLVVRPLLSVASVDTRSVLI